MIDLKNKVSLFGIVLIILTFLGCKEDPSPIPNNYEFFLEFKNKNGVNLLTDFSVNNFTTDIVVKSEKGEVVNTSYSIIEYNNNKILKINSSTKADDKLEVITYIIQNEELMGNTEKHVLDAKWLFSDNKIVLSEFYKNGDKLPPIKENHFSYYVLTRE